LNERKKLRLIKRYCAALCLFSWLTFSQASGQQNSTPGALPQIDKIVEDAIAQHQVPGAVVLVGHNGQIVYRRAIGDRAIEPRREAMTAGTIFDIASLTKVIVTTTAIMQLVEQGSIRLNDSVVRYLPEFGSHGKQEITVRELLTHYSGLAPDLDLKQQWQGRDTAYRMAFDETPVTPPGAVFEYSDINFIVLGSLVERVSGQRLDDYADEHIFKPLGMAQSRFLPPGFWASNIAPTEYDERGQMLRGIVHDPTARRMGGVAGHAGLFSTADDLAKFAQAILDGGGKILTPVSVEKMTTPQQPPNMTSVRGLGWDIDSPFSSNRGELLPVGSFGHTGFTGTSLWIDPTTNTYIIILSNAVHPRGKGSAVQLRAKVATAVAAALDLTVPQQERLRLRRLTGYNEAATASRNTQTRNGVVKTGIDVLEDAHFEIKGLHTGSTSAPKRIGLLTNQTGVDSQGKRTIDLMAHAPGFSLTAIFSPEHGAEGRLDTTSIGNSRDTATGVPIYSVYGATDAQRRPPPEVLRNLDAIFIDLQDAGARFYTYETTVGYFLEAAAQAKLPVIVLDRPNPITGSIVQGPMSDSGSSTFTHYFPLPVRHGMTLGELARMFNAERHVNAQLTVIPMQGWMRGDWYDSTSLHWIPPSPNLRSLAESTLYPGVALVEGTNVAVGRGTDSPFELVGAPWINSREFAAYLNSRLIAGVRFVPVSFNPSSGPYAGQLCQGVDILLLDRASLDAPELGMELASALRKLYPQQYHMDRITDILANQAAFDWLNAGLDPHTIAEQWREPLQQFQEMRRKYLLY